MRRTLARLLERLARRLGVEVTTYDPEAVGDANGVWASIAALGPLEPLTWYWLEVRAHHGGEPARRAVPFRTDEQGRVVMFKRYGSTFYWEEPVPRLGLAAGPTGPTGEDLVAGAPCPSCGRRYCRRRCGFP